MRLHQENSMCFSCVAFAGKVTTTGSKTWQQNAPSMCDSALNFDVEFPPFPSYDSVCQISSLLHNYRVGWILWQWMLERNRKGDINWIGLNFFGAGKGARIANESIGCLYFHYGPAACNCNCTCIFHNKSSVTTILCYLGWPSLNYRSSKSWLCLSH